MRRSTAAVGVIGAAIVLTFVALTAGMVLQRAEQAWVPVIVDWKPLDVRREGSDLIVSGTMRKARQCQYLTPPRARTIEGQGLFVTSLSPTQLQSWQSSDVPQNFGPWIVYGGAGHVVTFHVEHRCHPLWTQITHLGEVDNR